VAKKPPAPSPSAPLAQGAHDPSELKPREDACRACELFARATQAVPGEGDAHARILLIGEQPGHEEDLAGHPFVGPAGRLLDKLLEEAGISREHVFVTNAVKHFNWEGTRGDRRLHARPKPPHVRACFGWLEAEIRMVRPRVIVCLGAVAAQALMGSKFSVTASHLKTFATEWAEHLVATIHPSAALRAPDHDAREKLRDLLRETLRLAKRLAGPR
jgi:uracil-DNA glycosylase family protein